MTATKETQAGHWMTEDELSRLADDLDGGN